MFWIVCSVFTGCFKLAYNERINYFLLVGFTENGFWGLICLMIDIWPFALQSILYKDLSFSLIIPGNLNLISRQLLMNI